jgi:hypothetical protein
VPKESKPEPQAHVCQARKLPGVLEILKRKKNLILVRVKTSDRVVSWAT